MDLNHEQKFIVLLEIKKEKIIQLENIRTHSINITSWSTGIFLILVGYVVQSNLDLNLIKRIIFSSSIFIASAIIFWFINELEKGFKKQIKALLKIEDAFGLYLPGYYVEDRIFPDEWRNPPRGRVFIFSKLFIVIGCLFIICLLSLKGILF